MSDGDDGPAAGDEPPPSAEAARSPSTDPKAPDPESPRRRLVVVGVVVLMLGASVAGVAWALTQSPDEPVTEPQLQFDLSAQPDGPVTLSHGGGDEVPAGDIVVEVDGDRATWADLRFDTGPDDSVQAGDSVTLVGVESGDTVTVFYAADGQEVRLATIAVTAG